MGETDAMINQKVKAALAAGLQVILCVGETLDERKEGRDKEVFARHVAAGLAGVDAGALARLVLAYEPVWAIGTGKTATPDMAAEAHHIIRTEIAKLLDAQAAKAVRILYGGSVKPENACDLLCQAEIDGALVGGASLKPDSFAAIVKY